MISLRKRKIFCCGNTFGLLLNGTNTVYPRITILFYVFISNEAKIFDFSKYIEIVFSTNYFYFPPDRSTKNLDDREPETEKNITSA